MRYLFLAALLSGSAAAQPLGGWAMYFGQARFTGSPVSIHAEAQFRYHELTGDLDQILLRAGPQYTIPGTRTTLTQGIAYVRSEARGEPDNGFDEVRLYQEALIGQRAGPVRLHHRLRVEERFVESRDFSTRVRYALQAAVPITGNGLQRGSVYGAAYVEPFLNGPVRGGRSVYDRTRVYGALGVRAADNLGVQAGGARAGLGREHRLAAPALTAPRADILNGRVRRGLSLHTSIQMRTALLLLLALTGVAPAAQIGTWSAYGLVSQIGKTPLLVQADVQLRSHAALRDFDQAVLRIGLGARVGRVRLMQGIAVSATEAAGTPDLPRQELRAFQDVAASHAAGPVRFNHRLRVEERFFESTGLRGRYQLSATLPMRGAVYAAASVEPFLRGPGRGEQPVYDRTRLFSGLGVRLSPAFDARAGVLVQQFRSASDVQIQLSLAHTVPF